MGACGSNDTDSKAIIQIKNDLEEQNALIQELMSSTKDGFKSITDKCSLIDNQVRNMLQNQQKDEEHRQKATLEQKVCDLSSQIQTLNRRHSTPGVESIKQQHDSRQHSQSAHDSNQRTFPKPRTIKLSSQNSNSRQADTNDQQLNSINFKLDSLRNSVRREMLRS